MIGDEEEALILRVLFESGEMRRGRSGVRLQLNLGQGETGFVFVGTVSELTSRREHRL